MENIKNVGSTVVMCKNTIGFMACRDDIVVLGSLMKFDKFGKRVTDSSEVQIFNGLCPELLNELESLEIENFSVRKITDMIFSENSGKAFGLLFKMAKSQKGGLTA